MSPNLMLFLLSLLLFSCADPQAKVATNTETISTEMNNPTTKNITFDDFMEEFPTMKFPLVLIDQETFSYTTKGVFLPEEGAMEYICTNNLVCKATSDSKATKGQNISQEFMPYAAHKSDKFIILIYNINVNYYKESYLATYSLDGKMISRLLFSGGPAKSDEATDGTLNKNLEITIKTTLYDLDEKYEESAIAEEKKTNYSILEDGKIINAETKEVVEDDIVTTI